MGYTHYTNRLVTTPELAEFAKNAIRLSGVSICDGSGEGKPRINNTHIILNGNESYGEACEALVLLDKYEPDETFRFVKTARQPYDMVVTAILLAAIMFQTPGWETMKTDGDFDDLFNSGGVGLYARTFCQMYDDDPFDPLFRTNLRHFLRKGEE